MYRESPQETSVFCVLQLENIEIQKSKVTFTAADRKCFFLHKGSKKNWKYLVTGNCGEENKNVNNTWGTKSTHFLHTAVVNSLY